MSTVVEVRQDLGRHPAAYPLGFRGLHENRQSQDSNTAVATRPIGNRPLPSPDPIIQLTERAIEYASWEPGWDGADAERIRPLTVRNLIGILESTIPVIEPPHIAPAMTGEILVQWTFGDHDYVEIYVGEKDVFPTEAHTVQNRSVSDELLTDDGDLIALLARARTRP